MKPRRDGPVVLFSALSIYDRHGGTQTFNRRVVRTLGEAASSSIGRLVVLSLIDPGPGDVPRDVEFVPCRGSRSKMVASHLRCLVRHRPDVVILANATLTPLATLTRLVCPRSRVALCVHGVDVWDDPLYRRKRWFEPWTIRTGVDVILSVSDYTERRMRAAYGLEDHAFRRLPNAVDVDPDRSPSPDLRRNEEAGPRILSVTKLASTERAKGLDRAISAVARIRTRFPGLRYEIVGDGVLRAELARQARDLGLGDIVRFRGGVSDEELERLYREADLFLLPSRKEGFGIVFLEAWKHGLAVVCGNRDASSEVVTHGRTGLTVDPDSVEAIAAAVSRLLSDPGLRAELSRRGFEHMTAHYTQRHFADNLMAVVGELCPHTHPRGG